jgi:hypothetical protein
MAELLKSISLRSMSRVLGACLGYVLGSTWGQLGVHLGSIWGSKWGSKSDFNGRPFLDLLLTSLGRILGPSWAPSWPHVGGLGASWGALGRSWRDLGSIGDRFLTILEQHAKTRGFKTAGCSKNLQKHCVFQWFLKVPRGQHEASWGGFWRRLGASWALLEPSWASWARLGSVLGLLGKAYEAYLGNIFEK